MAPDDPLLGAALNLSRFHREHEKFYSEAPLEQAIRIQRFSRTLKALGERWQQAEPAGPSAASPFAGAEDLNDTRAIEMLGVLFMEGGDEPAEISGMKAELTSLASATADGGAWLAGAMEQAWAVAERLIGYGELADLLGERHRIIANDWQSAQLQLLIAKLLARVATLLEAVDFSPAALRDDLGGERKAASLLLSASELLDRAADLFAESAALVHDNERRWRVFAARLTDVLAVA